MFLNVPLLNDENGSVALLVEQQHRDDEKFALKMLELYVRLRDKSRTKTTALAIFTGSVNNADRFVDSCYGVELSFKYNAFYLPEKEIDDLRRDKRPFARVVLAGRMSLDAGDDVKAREAYAWEMWNTTTEQDYENRERRFILDFSNRIFRLSDPMISQELKEAYKMRIIPLRDYVREIELEDAREEGIEKGIEQGIEEGIKKGKMEGIFEVARSMLADGSSAETIRKYTGLNEKDILSLS
ncbi:MAG: hypothetical protein LBS00_05670 [Synergistaceae bacterium]|nr:hypothetical protein [Synergistaceae bacterium]